MPACLRRSDPLLYYRVRSGFTPAPFLLPQKNHHPRCIPPRTALSDCPTARRKHTQWRHPHGCRHCSPDGTAWDQYPDMLLFVSKSQANPAQAGDIKLKGLTGSAGCRQRAAVILPDPLLCGFLKRRSRQARSNLAAGSIKAAQRPLCVLAVSKTGYTEHKTLSDVGVPRPEGVFLRAETSG